MDNNSAIIKKTCLGYVISWTNADAGRWRHMASLAYNVSVTDQTCIRWSHTGTTVKPKKYAHGFCFAVLCCCYTLTDFPISIRLTSLALWQSNDCPSASKAALMNIDIYFMWIHYERLHNHNKAKHNKTVYIFLGVCSSSTPDVYKPPSRCCFWHLLLGVEMELHRSQETKSELHKPRRNIQTDRTHESYRSLY